MGRKRGKTVHLAVRGAGGVGGTTPKESDVSDLESLAAYSSVMGGGGSTVEEEEMSDLDALVENFAEQIDDAQDKKAGTRMRAIGNICRLLKHYSLTMDSVEKWKLTLCDVVERSLKRTQDEVLLACSLASLICVQLGVTLEEPVVGILGAMKTTMADPTASEAARAACAQAIGVCVCLSCGSALDVSMEALRLLRAVWSGVKVSSSSGAECQPKLCEFLRSPSVDIRISAGEALAALHEMGVSRLASDFTFDNIDELEELLNDLALDSNKHRAKRDRKAQKLSFRQINDAILNDSSPQTKIRFNKHETLTLEGCCARLSYDALCQLLKNDMNKHLTMNKVVRDYFGLEGPIQVESERETKTEKAERMNRLSAESKARNIHRGRQRDNKAY